MNKTLFAAVVAALACGFAQAVNISWDWASEPKLPTGDIAGNIYTSGSNDQEVFLKVSSAPASAISAISIASTEKALNTAVDFSDIYLSVRNAEGTEVAKSLVVVTQNAGYNSSTNSSGNGKVLQFAFEDEITLQKGFTLHVVNEKGASQNFVLAVTQNGGSDAFTPVQGTSEKTDYNPYVGYGTATISSDPVPEPTALALLALGVAGLALRRRAA